MTFGTSLVALTLATLVIHPGITNPRLPGPKATNVSKNVCGHLTARRVPPSRDSRLRKIALSLARANGDEHPSLIEAVATTRCAALTVATPGDSVTHGNTALVYLIVMKGNFTAYAASPPYGAALPTGHYLSVVIDQRSYEVLDYGLSEKPPPKSPSTLGAVVILWGRS
jgi:hypothetical protein